MFTQSVTRGSVVAAMLSLITLFAGAAHADHKTTKQGDIMIMEPWARPSIGQAKNSAAFFLLHNMGSTDRFIDVKSDIADRVEIHTHVKEGNVMRMRKLEDGVALPGGEKTLFKPHGKHVMFLGLNRKLKEGDVFPLTLVFEKAGSVTTDVTVAPLRGMKKKDGAHGHHH